MNECEEKLNTREPLAKHVSSFEHANPIRSHFEEAQSQILTLNPENGF